MRVLTIAALAAVTLAVAACGGGGGSSVAPGSSPIGGLATNAPGTVATQQTVPMSLTITIPTKKTTSQLRPQYIDPNSQSISFTLASVNGVAVANPTAQGPFNLVAGAGNSNCTAGPNGTTCTFSITAPIGNDIFTAQTFSNTNGTGPLGSGAIALNVQQNRANTASLTLTGPVTGVQLFASTQILYNGNPVPAPQCSDCAAARYHGNVASASRKPRAVGTRRPSGVVVSATPAPVGPVATTARIYVIATDVNGNQIINPTTFDVNITLTLALNGANPGDVTLTNSYAGLPGEPASPASTTADGGTVTVIAPSDNITMTLSTHTNVTAYAPTLTASYTPQGGAAQTSTPLAVQLLNPPPGSVLEATANHVDPLSVGTAANLTDAVVNIGTAPTSGTIYADAYNYFVAYNGTGPGSDPSWSCTPYNGGSYFSISCSSNAIIPAGGSLPLVLSITPTSSGTNTNYYYAYGGSATNSNQYPEADDTINVESLAMTTSSSANPFYGTVPATLTYNLWNTGSVDSSGSLTLTASLPSNPNPYTYAGFSGTNWSCTGATPTITCTFTGTLPAGGTSSSNNSVLTINVTPPQSDTDAGGGESWSGSVTGGGLQPATANGNAYQQSPVYFDSAPGFNAILGTQFGNAFVPGDQSTLDIGSPPSSPLNGSVSITTQSATSGHYTIVSDNCTSNLIDTTFAGTFSPTPLVAGAVGSGVTANLNVLSQPGAAGPCQIVIQDANANTASLNIGVDQTQITARGYHRKAGSKY